MSYKNCGVPDNGSRKPNSVVSVWPHTTVAISVRPRLGPHLSSSFFQKLDRQNESTLHPKFLNKKFFCLSGCPYALQSIPGMSHPFGKNITNGTEYNTAEECKRYCIYRPWFVSWKLTHRTKDTVGINPVGRCVLLVPSWGQFKQGCSKWSPWKKMPVISRRNWQKRFFKLIARLIGAKGWISTVRLTLVLSWGPSTVFCFKPARPWRITRRRTVLVRETHALSQLKTRTKLGKHLLNLHFCSQNSSSEMLRRRWSTKNKQQRGHSDNRSGPSDLQWGVFCQRKNATRSNK